MIRKIIEGQLSAWRTAEPVGGKIYGNGNEDLCTKAFSAPDLP